MKPPPSASRLLGALLLLGALNVHPAANPPPPPLNDLAAGQELAAELRALRPAEAAAFAGTLKIRGHGRPVVAIPLTSKIEPGAQSWQVSYQTGGTNQIAAEKLVVIHFTNRPNEYLFARATSSNAPPGEPQPLPRGQMFTTLAGSDFSFTDLGLEFFHWPHQMLVQKEMRKGRSCRVLESRPAVTNDYARVVSWIDLESGGLLMAEAYDRANERVKQFEVNSVAQGQVRKMEMLNLKDGTRTSLEFDPPKAP